MGTAPPPAPGPDAPLPPGGARAHDLAQPKPPGAPLPRPAPPEPERRCPPKRSLPPPPPPPPPPSPPHPELLAALRDLQSAIVHLAQPPAAPRPAPPFLLHLAAAPSAQTQTQFDLTFEPPVRTLSGSAVYLTELSVQGALPSAQVLALSLSFLKPAMHSSAPNGGDRVFVAAPSLASVPSNGVAAATFRATDTRDFPARLVGFLSAPTIHNARLGLHAFAPSAGSYSAPWIPDASVAASGSPSYDATAALLARGVSLTLMVIPPAL